jgi:hypothetical protein
MFEELEGKDGRLNLPTEGAAVQFHENSNRQSGNHSDR